LTEHMKTYVLFKLFIVVTRRNCFWLYLCSVEVGENCAASVATDLAVVTELRLKLSAFCY